MDFTVDIERLNGVVEALDTSWSKQNNVTDNKTKFIYRISSYAELISDRRMLGLTEDERQYALHRWYNNKTSEVCEKIFIEYGARKATNDENVLRHIDVFIDDVPYDIKLSVFPSNYKVQQMHLDMTKRSDKNRLIRWFYNNQSTEQRNCFNNRIFVVCNGNNTIDNYWLKQNFDQMDVKIKSYMEYLSQIDYQINEIVVSDRDGNQRTVKSDIIVINTNNRDIKQRLDTELCPVCNSRYQLMVARLATYSGNIILKCPNCRGYENV